MRVLYLDNYDSFSDLIKGELESRGHQVIKYSSNADLNELPSDFDALLLGPGPNSPSESGNYLAAIEKFSDKPIRGICLGFQTLANYFGATIEPIPLTHGRSVPVINNSAGVFTGLPELTNLARYNSLGVYRKNLPNALEETAYEGDLVMGFRHKEKDIEAIQFHPESILSGAAGKHILDRLL